MFYLFTYVFKTPTIVLHGSFEMKCGLSNFVTLSPKFKRFLLVVLA